MRSFADLFDAITSNIAQVLHGKHDTIELAVMCLLAEGHLCLLYTSDAADDDYTV